MIHHCPTHEMSFEDDAGCLIPGCTRSDLGPVPNTTGEAHARRTDLRLRREAA